MIGMGDQGCGLGALQGNMLDFELGEEIIRRNALVGNGGETSLSVMHTGDLVRELIEMIQQKRTQFREQCI